jgi:hypothetical protein
MDDKLLVVVAPCIPPYLAQYVPGLNLPPEGIANEVVRAYNAGTGRSVESVRSDVTLGQMVLTAHVCAVKVVVSNQLLGDSDPAVDAILKGLFAETLADAFDTAILRGAGTATDPITGLANRITTNSLAAGASFDRDDVINLIHAVYENSPNAPEVPIIGHSKGGLIARHYIQHHGGDLGDGDIAAVNPNNDNENDGQIPGGLPGSPADPFPGYRFLRYFFRFPPGSRRWGRLRR